MQCTPLKTRPSGRCSTPRVRLEFFVPRPAVVQVVHAEQQQSSWAEAPLLLLDPGSAGIERHPFDGVILMHPMQRSCARGRSTGARPRCRTHPRRRPRPLVSVGLV